MQAVDQQALVPAGRFLRCQGRFLLNEMFQQLGDALNWGESAIAPDAVGKLIANGLRVPFYFEYELRARHPRGVVARLRPYTSYYWSNEPDRDQPPFPTTLFVVDGEDVRGHLREHGGPHEPDDAAHPGVLLPRAVPGRDTGPVLASPLGAGVPEAGAVGAEGLPLGLALPPDGSCRGTQIGRVRPISPPNRIGVAKSRERSDFQGLPAPHCGQIGPIPGTLQMHIPLWLWFRHRILLPRPDLSWPSPDGQVD